jgi:hypothetical protein
MNDSGPTELVYEDFVMRLDGPMIEVVGSSFKGLFRLHVNFAQAERRRTARRAIATQ